MKKFILIVTLLASACTRAPQPASRTNAPQAQPVLFHVEQDFIVVEISIAGYTGNLRCLERIDRWKPDGSFRDERCYWVTSEFDAQIHSETPAGTWQPEKDR